MTPQLHRRLTKIVAFLTAMRGSALIMVSGEQVGSTEKWTAPAAEARKKNPVAVTESSLTAGQKIYLKRCVACHGKTGNGDGPDAADLGKPRPTPIKSHLIFARLIHARPPFSLPCSRAITPPSWQATVNADTLAHRSLSEDEVPGRLRIKVFHGDSENAKGIRGNVGFEKIQDVASENLRIISDWIAARDEGRAINLDRRKHFHFHREKCSRELA